MIKKYIGKQNFSVISHQKIQHQPVISYIHINSKNLHTKNVQFQVFGWWCLFPDYSSWVLAALIFHHNTGLCKLLYILLGYRTFHRAKMWNKLWNTESLQNFFYCDEAKIRHISKIFVNKIVSLFLPPHPPVQMHICLDFTENLTNKRLEGNTPTPEKKHMLATARWRNVISRYQSLLSVTL